MALAHCGLPPPPAFVCVCVCQYVCCAFIPATSAFITRSHAIYSTLGATLRRVM